MTSPQSHPLREYTNVPLEIFIIAFSILPFFVLAYFYPLMPERVPVFVTLSGEVETWAEKSVISVFRVPLMAVITQIFLLLMKYGTLHSVVRAPLSTDQAKLQEQYFRLNARLWDWFRWAVAIKMSAESLNTIFLSLERFKFLARPTFIISAIAALVGVAGALFYGYRLFVVMREMKEKFVDAFVSEYFFNVANKLTWVLIACIIAYSLLVFLPG